jgi:hypothetical protein
MASSKNKIGQIPSTLLRRNFEKAREDCSKTDSGLAPRLIPNVCPRELDGSFSTYQLLLKRTSWMLGEQRSRLRRSGS